MITLTCGGVGGAKIALGLYRVLPPDSLTVIVNTADDTEHWGLHVSPDVDTVTYTLAGIAGDLGWGIRGDTTAALEMMQRYGAASWFQIGDRDLATDILRTDALRRGETLSAVTARVARALGTRARVLPMTDDRVATRLRVDGEWLDFQEYFVHRGHAVPVEETRYEGVEDASPAGGVLQALTDADAVVLANSNPVLSILPILALRGVRETLKASPVPRVAVSPMLGRGSVSGPAGDLMRTLGEEATSLGVARTYRGLIDGIVIADEDADQADEIEALGIRVHCTQTVMIMDADKDRLAREVLAFARGLR